MPRKSKAAKLAEAAAAELEANPKPFLEQDPGVSPIGPDAGGHFPKSNAGGPGNPHARHCARMLELFRSAICDEEMYVLCRILFERASTGDMSAMKMIWQYKLGKPLTAPNPDAIDRDEWNHFQQDAMSVEEMKKVLSQLPSRIGNAIVSAALPSIAETVSQTLAAQLFQSLPADYYAQPAAPAEQAPTQPESTPSAACTPPNSQETSPISNGISVETNPIPNGFSPETSPISNGISAEKNSISNGFSPELDADGLPSRQLPPGLPPRSSATRQTPPARRSSPVSNGKSQKSRKTRQETCSFPSVGLEQLRFQCAW